MSAESTRKGIKDKGVIANSPAEGVVANSAIEGVIASATIKDVITFATANIVWVACTGEVVVKATTNDSDGLSDVAEVLSNTVGGRRIIEEVG